MLSVAKNCLSPGSAPLRDASTNNLKKQDSMDVFKMYFIDYNTFDTSNIILRYPQVFNEKTWYKIMPVLITKRLLHY